MPPLQPALVKLFELTYDLRRPSQNYPALHAALREAGALHLQQSTYWLPSTLSAIQIRDVMMTLLDRDDSVNVVEMSGEVAGYEARPEVREWIERYLAAFKA